MKRLVVFYSLSGNTGEAAKKIAEGLCADVMELETVKKMPKSFAARIFVGGGQVAMDYVPMLGMLMLPKTVCYMALIRLFFKYSSGEERISEK